VSTQCFDPLLNRSLCCTEDCEVLGVGLPEWSLIDETRPADGGVVLRHTGVGAMTGDPYGCGIDPVTQAQLERMVDIYLRCNPALDDHTVEPIAAYENTTCRYVIELETGASCGCAPNCQGKSCGPDGCGGFCSGASLAGQCPYGQTCMPDQTCCRNDCTNRDCGSDNCGGSCGTCGSDQSCSSAQVCVSTAALIPVAPVQYGPDSGGLAGSFVGGVAASIACAGAVWFFGMGGKNAFDKWRYGGAGQATGAEASRLVGGGTSASSTASTLGGGGSIAAAASSSGGKYTSYGS